MDEAAGIETLKAIAHPVRYRLLQALRDGERNVGEIEEITGVAQPALSQQLAVLRQLSLVDTRRDGKLVYYMIDQAVLGGALLHVNALAGPAPAPAPSQDKPISGRMQADGVAQFARMA